jgi:hypothetical protein
MTRLLDHGGPDGDGSFTDDAGAPVGPYEATPDNVQALRSDLLDTLRTR